MRREFSWQLPFLVINGFLLGLGLTQGLLPMGGGWLWVPVYVLLATLAAWLTIPLDPHGYVNLAPAVFLTVALVSNLGLALVVAASAPLIAALVLQGAFSRDAILASVTTGGEAALSLAVAGVGVRFYSTARPDWLDAVEISAACLLVMFVLQAARVTVLEGVKTRRLLGPMVRNGLPHLLAIGIGVLLIWATSVLIGPVGVALATIVLVEMYYPWKLLGEQRDLFLKSLQMISNAVDLKDPYTAHHSQRVSVYATKMARQLNVPEIEVQRIRMGALMHDIGKVGVPGNVIRKPSKLTEDEMALMKTHDGAGASVVEELQILKISADIVRHHHENFDGTGYPSGLAGKEIPLGARIVFVADAYDALTTDRPYRHGRATLEAVKILEANVGNQFDPRAVDALRKILIQDSRLNPQ